MNHGLRHQNKRKKPTDKKFVKLLDKVCMVFAVLMPATTIPQIWQTFYYKDVSGVSLSMWVLYFLAVIPWFIYGIVHKARPILLLNFLWMIVQGVMVVGILMYR